MEDVFSFADELGPAKVVHTYEPKSGLKAVLVVDNVAKGPAIGGVRMAPDVSTEECFRLARAMTFKNAAAGLPHGGGKVVLYGDPKMPLAEKEQLIRALCRSMENEREYIFAPDMGTDETCMAWIKDEIDRVVGLPRVVGGIPLDEVGATGFGLGHVVDVAIPYCDFDLKGARLAIQGFGAVGRHAARFITARGAMLVAAADTSGTLHDPEGIDVAELIALKDAGRSVVDYPRGQKLPVEAIIDVPCEIWIPAARPDVIHDDNVDRLQAKLVVEGANIPITHSAEATLQQRGVLCVPDFIANAGGVICAAVEYLHGTQSQAFAAIEEKIRTNTREVLEEARTSAILPRQAAIHMATRRVRRAMASRRWNIF